MLSAFTSHLDAGTPLADPPASEPTPELREKPLMPMPLGLCYSGARSDMDRRTARGS